jgi:hypothetical protein
MQLTLLKGYPDYVGKRQIFCGNGTGPTSYVQKTSTPNAGGDIVTYPPFQNYIDIIFPAMSLSGTYIVYPYPVVVGPRQVWALKWVTISTGTEVAASTNLSAESVQLAGFAGVY